jgi:uncharacterized membrane protein
MTSAKITKIIDSGIRYTDGLTLPFQTLELTITSGDKVGQKIQLSQSATPQMQLPKYDLGEKVFLDQSTIQPTPDQSITTWVIADYNRQEPLLALSFLFVSLVILVGKWRGFWSLVALCLSFLIITFVTVPLMANGWNAIAVSVLTSAIILPINFYLSHGWQLKTHLAIISTILALLLTSFLAQFFIQAAHLTGMASEEAGFLMIEKPGIINFQSLILAAVIVGALGILDDVTVSQTSVVFELKTANPNFGWRELYLRGMKIGQDHISSMVNTLILVYAGAALPLLLLFSHNLKPLGELVNLEIISEEIIKTLAGSIGLIFAAPLATFLATLVLSHPKFSQKTWITKSHSPHH